jgi:micrococcal nuclease
MSSRRAPVTASRVLALAVTLALTPSCAHRARSQPSDVGVVRHVVDGDTIDVDIGGHRERVRLIGIDTPEIEHPGQPAECYGDDATALTRELVDGEEVRLSRDVEPRDDYGRLLAYVHRSRDGLFLNAALVEAGAAEILRIEPNVTYAVDLANLAAQARRAGRGLWGPACAG